MLLRRRIIYQTEYLIYLTVLHSEEHVNVHSEEHGNVHSEEHGNVHSEEQ